MYIKTLFIILIFTSNTKVSNAQTLDEINKKVVDYYQNQDFNNALRFALKSKNLSLAKWGNNNLNYANSIYILGCIYHSLRKYPEAENSYIEALKIREKLFGVNNTDCAGSLNNLGILYLETGKYDKAESCLVSAVNIRLKLLGKNNPDYATSLNNLANLYFTIGNYKKAEPLLIEALSINQRTLGETNQNYATALYNLGQFYQTMGSYAKADSCISKALQIFKDNGNKSLKYGEATGNAASLYENMGFSEKAEKLYKESLSILEKSIGTQNSSYALILSGLAMHYKNISNYPKALRLLQESISIIESISGKNNLDYATALNTLGELYVDMGDYKNAEVPLLKSTSIRKEVLGKNTQGYISSLNALALFYQELGNYKKSESFLLDVLAIEKNIYGEKSPDYAYSLNNLGTLYQIMGNTEKAETYFLDAMNIRKDIIGDGHPDYASNLHNLALIYLTEGNYEKAELFLKKSLITYEKWAGKITSNYAAILCDLAQLYQKTNRLDSAEIQLTTALSIYNQISGENTPDYSIAQFNLATLYLQERKYPTVEILILKSLKNLNVQIQQNFSFLSEQEKRFYFKSISSYFDFYNSYLFEYYLIKPQISITSYNNELQNKGMVLRSANQIRSNLRKSGDTSLLNTFEKLTKIKSILSKIYALPNDKYPSNVKEIENEEQMLDKTLVRHSQLYSQYKTQFQITWRMVQNKLKANEAAVEFINFKNFSSSWNDSTLYGALILRSEYKYPKLVRLFGQKELAVLRKYTNNNDSSFLNLLYDSRDNELYTLIWQPLDTLLKGVKTIYAAPSGILNKINLGAIPINADSTFGTKYNLHILGTTADIINYSPLQINKNTIDHAYLFGGIDYDKANNSITIFNNSEDNNYAGLGQVSTSAERGYGHSWSYLPGTLKEGSEIQSLCNKAGIKTTLLTGRNASENNFKSLSGSSKPFILHLATHGYFFPDIKKEKPKEVSLIVEDRGAIYKSSENPLLRSGLILAGANKSWGNDNYKSDSTEDGILTAYEVSNTDLSKAQLVVMSACETGLGDINGSEGVFGLQRGFKLAGAKDIIMSLWKVPDTQTSELLTLFYTNCQNGKSVPEALQSAQLQMQKKYPPYYWAAFKLLE